MILIVAIFLLVIGYAASWNSTWAILAVLVMIGVIVWKAAEG